jgi:lipoprotein-releasing system permease protein
VVVAFVTIAMVVVLSAFNGIEDLVKSLYSTLDAEIVVLPAKGKSFDSKAIHLDELRAIPGVRACSRVIQDEVLIRYNGRQTTAFLKGVDREYSQVVKLDSSLYDGSAQLERGKTPLAYMGAGLHYSLEMPPVRELLQPLEILALPKGSSLLRDKENALRQFPVNVGGLFSVNAEFDNRYIFVPISFAEECFNYGGRLSALELSIREGQSQDRVRAALEKKLGPGFKVTTREKKNELVFRTSQTEKWVTFLILIFIVVIAAFNILASLTMLIIDKRSDLSTLYALGLPRAETIRVFFYQSLLINAYGTVGGLIIGLGICFAQMYFGLLRLTGSVVEYYPVAVKGADILVILVVMSIISFSSYFGVQYLITKHTQLQKS